MIWSNVDILEFLVGFFMGISTQHWWLLGISRDTHLWGEESQFGIADLRQLHQCYGSVHQDLISGQHSVAGFQLLEGYQLHCSSVWLISKTSDQSSSENRFLLRETPVWQLYISWVALGRVACEERNKSLPVRRRPLMYLSSQQISGILCFKWHGDWNTCTVDA
jgi:hypothetical protein